MAKSIEGGVGGLQKLEVKEIKRALKTLIEDQQSCLRNVCGHLVLGSYHTHIIDSCIFVA